MPPPPLTEEPEDEEWMLTYADAITLLMAFFVMLASFSKIDLPMFEAVMAGIQQEIGMGKDKASSTSQEVKTALETAAFEMQMEQVVEVQKDPTGVVIEMASTSFFKPGTAELLPEALPLLKSWADILTKEEFKYFFVEVEGHTDDDPINTPQFPSNWELSVGRAATVVRNLQDNGVHKFQLKAAGFGEAHPKAPNHDEQGNPIPVNQAKNRRVIVRLLPMLGEYKDEFIQVLLEERLAREEAERRAKEEADRQAVQEKVDAANKEQGGGVTPAPAPAQ